MPVDEPVARGEAEFERIAGARAIAAVERQRDAAAVGVRLRAERQIACEAVHRQLADGAFAVAPEADSTLHPMAAEKRKQQRIAAANLRGIGPVCGIGPEDDARVADTPRQQPAARFGRDARARRAVDELEDVLILERGHGGRRRRSPR